jgi:hypothetical protein
MTRRLFAAIAMLAGACRSAPKGSAAPAVVPPPPPPDRGSVTATLIPAPDAPSMHLGPGEVYVAPQIMRGNPLPEYPPDLIPLKLAPHAVVVRITSNEYSGIDDVHPSPLGGTTDDQYRQRFEDAVSAAVSRWKVFPAVIRREKPGADLDGDGKPDYTIVTASKRLKAFFDIEFDFEVANGKALVRSGKPAGASVQP